MNSENAQKDIAQSFIDFVDMAKGLMDKNQQPFVPYELGRLPSTRGRGGGMKAESFLGLVLVNHLLQQLMQIKLVLQQSTTKRTIEKIWESKATSKKPWKCILHKTILGKTPSKFAILFHLKPSDFRFVTWFKSFLMFGLP